MFKKTQRLRTAGFNEVFAVGKRLHTPCFQIIFIKSADFHCSVVVGKKVYKTAVARNRLRRQLYAAVYSFSKTTPLPYAMILVAKPTIKTLMQKEIRPVVYTALVDLGAR